MNDLNYKIIFFLIYILGLNILEDKVIVINSFQNKS